MGIYESHLHAEQLQAVHVHESPQPVPSSRRKKENVDYLEKKPRTL